MTVINGARDSGDLELLQEISEDPQGYIPRQDLGELDLSERSDRDKLRATLAAIEGEIRARQDALLKITESADYAFLEACWTDPGLMAHVAHGRSLALEAEIYELDQEASQIEPELPKLTGSGGGIDFQTSPGNQAPRQAALTCRRHRRRETIAGRRRVNSRGRSSQTYIRSGA